MLLTAASKHVGEPSLGLERHARMCREWAAQIPNAAVTKRDTTHDLGILKPACREIASPRERNKLSSHAHCMTPENILASDVFVSGEERP